MSDAKTILRQARALGLSLSLADGRIAVAPARRCPPELLNSLRDHKQAVMDFLEAEAARLTPDCAPWLHIARQVLAGEFAAADSSTVETLNIGLRCVPHPLCQKALLRLRSKR